MQEYCELKNDGKDIWIVSVYRPYLKIEENRSIAPKNESGGENEIRNLKIFRNCILFLTEEDKNLAS